MNKTNNGISLGTVILISVLTVFIFGTGALYFLGIFDNKNKNDEIKNKKELQVDILEKKWVAVINDQVEKKIELKNEKNKKITEEGNNIQIEKREVEEQVHESTIKNIKNNVEADGVITNAKVEQIAGAVWCFDNPSKNFSIPFNLEIYNLTTKSGFTKKNMSDSDNGSCWGREITNLVDGEYKYRYIWQDMDTGKQMKSVWKYFKVSNKEYIKRENLGYSDKFRPKTNEKIRSYYYPNGKIAFEALVRINNTFGDHSSDSVKPFMLVKSRKYYKSGKLFAVKDYIGKYEAYYDELGVKHSDSWGYKKEVEVNKTFLKTLNNGIIFSDNRELISEKNRAKDCYGGMIYVPAGYAEDIPVLIDSKKRCILEYYIFD